MKARVKATGEIVEVKEEYDLRDMAVDTFYSNEDDPYDVYDKEELDFDVKEKSFPKDEDYWTRLEHQAAIAAMPIANEIVDRLYGSGCHPYNGSRMHTIDSFVDECYGIAHALVEKLKEESK